MKSPNAAGQTAIRVLGKDVVGSLQHRAIDGPHALNFLVALQKFFVNCKTARESRASSTAPTNPKIPYGVRLNYSIRHPDDRFLCQKEQGFFLAKESSICNQSCVLTADFRI